MQTATRRWAAQGQRQGLPELRRRRARRSPGCEAPQRPTATESPGQRRRRQAAPPAIPRPLLWQTSRSTGRTQLGEQARARASARRSEVRRVPAARAEAATCLVWRPARPRIQRNGPGASPHRASRFRLPQRRRTTTAGCEVCRAFVFLRIQSQYLPVGLLTKFLR